VPMNGREVRWYTCGPTVYDSSHVGHARSYLTFDIMRRIMSDYFKYNVLYQINITDIDDKIILRARQNELIARLEKDESVSFQDLVEMTSKAVEEATAKGNTKLEDIKAQIDAAKAEGNKRMITEQEEQLKMHIQKMENLTKELPDIETAKTDANQDRANLIKVAKGVLAPMLDREKGDSVTSHDVFNGHARRFEREYMEDMAALGIREPDVLTRVTEYIPEIIVFIEKIISKGLAYESNGSVYLSLDDFKKEHNYRKLSPAGGEDTSAVELEESEGALGDSNAMGKRNKSDFALWKGSKPGEPAWDSPWGQGRPGWHIECSVVASDILGEKLDIHSGGEDLKFPHHDNELAQSEACFGSQQWVNYFTHAGHLHIKGLKMSKSLKNFITIRQALEKHSSRQLRILFLLQPWNEQMNFSDQTVDDAKSKEKSFRSFFQEVQALSRDDYLSKPVGWQMGEDDRNLAESLLKAQETVHASLLDNFDTKSAMLAMLSLVSDANVYLRLPNAIPSILLLRRIATYITSILRVFGVVEGSDAYGFGSDSARGNGAPAEEVVTPYMNAFVEFREKVRAAALASSNKSDPAIQAVLEACDAVRDNTLVECGVRLEDRPDGSKWNLEDPEVLRREKIEKAEKEQEAKAQKLKNKMDKVSKDIEKCKQGMLSPADLFKTEEFGSWDEQGLPLTLADGTELSDGQKKKKKKLQDKQVKAMEDLKKKTNGDPAAHLAALEAELAALQNSA